jgi:FkbM family methyltransferase
MLIIDIIKTTRKIVQSSYTIKQKSQLIKTYLFLVFSNKFNRDQTLKKRYIKLFNYKIRTYNFKLFFYVFYEIFINEDYKFNSLNPNPIILDCGANLGLATIYFKLKYPNSKITAFEPDPDIFTLLKENIETNKFKDVKLINAALLDKNESIDFYSSICENSWNFGVGSITPFKKRTEKHIKVNSMKLSDFIQTTIDFAKIDIEGSEHLVIQDLTNTDKLGLIREYKIEYHHKIGTDLSMLGNFLLAFEKLNYEYQIRANFSRKEQQQEVLLYFYKN